MPDTEKTSRQGERFQTTLRQPLAIEVKRLAEGEGRRDGDMISALVEEAVKERAMKGLAQHV